MKFVSLDQQKGPSRLLIRSGRLLIDLEAKTAEVGGRRVRLSPGEYAILELLALSKGALVTKDMLIGRLYPAGTAPNQKVIDVFISKLRRKLREASRGDRFIHTIGKRGYTLRMDILGDR